MNSLISYAYVCSVPVKLVSRILKLIKFEFNLKGLTLSSFPVPFKKVGDYFLMNINIKGGKCFITYKQKIRWIYLDIETYILQTLPTGCKAPW